MESKEKRAYEAPELQEWGNVVELTQHAQSSDADSYFMVGSVGVLPNNRIS